MQKDIERKIGEILEALHAYRNNLVVVGGICASIYHCEKKETISEQLFTTDLDLARPDLKRGRVLSVRFLGHTNAF